MSIIVEEYRGDRTFEYAVDHDASFVLEDGSSVAVDNHKEYNGFYYEDTNTMRLTEHGSGKYFLK